MKNLHISMCGKYFRNIFINIVRCDEERQSEYERLGKRSVEWKIIGVWANDIRPTDVSVCCAIFLCDSSAYLTKLNWENKTEQSEKINREREAEKMNKKLVLTTMAYKFFFYYFALHSFALVWSTDSTRFSVAYGTWYACHRNDSRKKNKKYYFKDTKIQLKIEWKQKIKMSTKHIFFFFSRSIRSKSKQFSNSLFVAAYVRHSNRISHSTINRKMYAFCLLCASLWDLLIW